MSTCSDYIVDTAPASVNADQNTKAVYAEFLNNWDDEQKLNKWLDKYQIGETVFEIVSIEFETKEIKDEQIP
jgi:hypothetical protein